MIDGVRLTQSLYEDTIDESVVENDSVRTTFKMAMMTFTQTCEPTQLNTQISAHRVSPSGNPTLDLDLGVDNV